MFFEHILIARHFLSDLHTLTQLTVTILWDGHYSQLHFPDEDLKHRDIKSIAQASLVLEKMEFKLWQSSLDLPITILYSLYRIIG